MLLKVCGLREQDNVNAIAALKPQWMGFVFSPASSRYFNAAQNPADLKSISKDINKVGVFVNESAETVLAIYKQHELDYVQLHGNESAEYCKDLAAQQIKIIKAFSINEAFDFATTENFAPDVSLFLFDTAGKLPGGNGIQFNHNLLQGKRFSKPFLLSGGIGPADAQRIKNFHHPDLIGVDVNSKFENSPGLKNVAALQLFKQQIA